MLTSTNRTLYKLTKEANDPQAIFSQSRKASRDAAMPDPADVLNYKKHECRQITELHLGGRNVEHIHPNFQSFINLEILWLNDNKLTEIKNLLPEKKEHSVADSAKGCVRLKRLYLSNNRISTLLGDLQRLKYLEVLLLANNHLSNMELVSQQLAHLRFLQQLDLFGNPLAEEHNYRLFMIHNHPSLLLFDRQSVTDEERDKARETFAPVASTVAKVGFGTHTIPGKPIERVDAMSASAKLVEHKARTISMRNAAAKKLGETREATEFHQMSEKRRLFHSLWGSKPGAFMANPELRGMSQLFDLSGNGSNPDIEVLIELARERETTESAERKAQLDKRISSMKSALFPPRFGDEYAATLARSKEASFADDLAAYFQRIVPIVLMPDEQQAFRRVFESGAITKGEIAGMLRMLQNGLGDTIKASVLEAAYASWYPKHAKDGTGIDIADAEALLVSCIPLVQGRMEQHFLASQSAFVAGQPQQSQSLLHKANMTNDHLSLLRENADKATDLVVKLKRLTPLPKTGAMYEAARQRQIENSVKQVAEKKF